MREKNYITERINSFAKSSSFFSLDIYEPKNLNGFVPVLFLWIILVMIMKEGDVTKELKAVKAIVEKLSTGGGESATSCDSRASGSGWQ